MYLPDAQAALAFMISQATHIEAQVIEIKYPDIQYPALIPVDTSANEWAKSVTYFSSDKVGKAGWFHAKAKDIHVADVERAKFEVGIEMADIGYRFDLEEIGYAMLVPGTNLQVDRAAACRRAYEEFVDDVALHGDATKNYHGLLNYPGITVVNALADGGTGEDQADWNSKTADQILRDVNSAITGQYVDSLTVELADTVLLPTEMMTLIATKRIPDTAITVADFLATKNVYTVQTGRPLTIRGVRGLETAGVGNTGRMIVYRRDPQVIKLHIPMTHRFLPVFQTAPLVFDVPGIFRLGGVEVRRPGAVRYVDGIMDAPYA